MIILIIFYVSKFNFQLESIYGIVEENMRIQSIAMAVFLYRFCSIGHHIGDYIDHIEIIHRSQRAYVIDICGEYDYSNYMR